MKALHRTVSLPSGREMVIPSVTPPGILAFMGMLERKGAASPSDIGHEATRTGSAFCLADVPVILECAMHFGFISADYAGGSEGEVRSLRLTPDGKAILAVMRECEAERLASLIESDPAKPL